MNKKIILLFLLILFSFIFFVNFKGNGEEKIKEIKNEVSVENQKKEEFMVKNKIEEDVKIKKSVKDETKKNNKSLEEENKINNFIKKNSIKNYKIILKNIKINNNHYRTLRSFNSNNIEKYLAVNLETGKTEILIKKDVSDDIDLFYKKSKYYNIKNDFINKTGITNVGLKNNYKKNESEVYWTADFCPSSKKSFEKYFFEKFIQNGYKNIAIAITKSWVDKHKESFLWLIKQRKLGNLNIIWVNHSSNHRYKFSEKRLDKNFLLLPNTNLEEEILDTEKMLISYGEKPSVFFRFPGLVSNKKIRNDLVNKYGLIYIGSNAWLAKGQKPKKESIILIHGNLNEHDGIIKALKILEDDYNLKDSSLENILKN